MIDPFLAQDTVEEPLTFNDWLNITNALDLIEKAWGDTFPDKPLPRDLDGTIRRTSKASLISAKQNPHELLEMLSNMVARKEDDTSS